MIQLKKSNVKMFQMLNGDGTIIFVQDLAGKHDALLWKHLD